MLLLVTVLQSYSQTQGISYQAVILNPQAQQIPGVDVQGNILANTTVGIQFTITDGSGNEEYQESHSTSTDMYGMINLLIGTGNTTSYNSFLDIVWDGTAKKLKVAIDFTGSSNYSPLSEQNLTYMPQPVTPETLLLITDNTVSIIEEEIRATVAEATLITNLSLEVTNRTNADLLKEDVSNKSTDVTTDGASDTKYPSVKSVKTYVDASSTSVSLDLATEVARATAAEGVNATAISTETTNRIADVDAEQTRATAALSLMETNFGNLLDSKVDIVAGKSLIDNTEITRLAGVSNVNISGKAEITYVDSQDALKADLTLSNLLNAATARTNLGLAIGTDVQAYDADLDDLADGTLSASKVENAITTAGTSGEVWTSDGSGAGTWSVPVNSIIQVGDGLVISGTGTVAAPYNITLPTGGTTGQVLTIGGDGVPAWADASAGGSIYYLDDDGDGYGDINVPIVAVTMPSGYVSDNTDCDDTDSAINPVATEVCDGIDNDCDGAIDEGFAFTTYYTDADADGYGDSNDDTGTQHCTDPGVGFSLNNTDCDDADSSINPEVPELTYYVDADGDGYGDVNDVTGTVFCANPGGYSITNDDCDDSNSAIKPGATEIGGNSVDENCDGNLYVVGDYAYGGVVFYIAPTPTDLNGDGAVDFGLVCSIADLNAIGIIWSSNGVTTGAVGEAVGTGKDNTDILIAKYGSNTNYAAGLARAYSGGSYTDWFLPSKTSVKLMYNNKAIINATAALNGGSDFIAPGNGYWSSSEFSVTYAWRVKWTTGGTGFNLKASNTLGVRAVRAF